MQDCQEEHKSGVSGVRLYRGTVPHNPDVIDNRYSQGGEDALYQDQTCSNNLGEEYLCPGGKEGEHGTQRFLEIQHW